MKRILQLTIGIVLVLLLAACSNDSAQETPTPPADSALPTPEPIATTAAPPPTQVPATALLLAADSADPSKTAEAEAALNEAAPASGLQILRQTTLDPAAAPAGLRLVVVVCPGNDPAALSAALPQVQFVALGCTGLTPTANLTVISSGAGDPNLAFTAGYIAAVQSDEYRIGVITTNDAAGQSYRTAFVNGVIYYCGTCTPIYPPYETYPVYVELPSNASPTELEAAAEVLYSRGVTMVHVIPSLQTDAIYVYLAQLGMRLVGTAAPPAGLEGYWVASILLEPEMSLSATLQSVLNTGALGQVGAKLAISYTGASAARISHFEEIIHMLEDGTIDPVGAVN